VISIDIFTTNTAKILYTSISSLPSSSYTLPNGHIIYIGQAWTIGHKIVPFLSQGQSSEIGAVEYLWHGNHLFWNVYFSNNRQECPTDRAGQHQSNNLDNHSFWVNGLKKIGFFTKHRTFEKMDSIRIHGRTPFTGSTLCSSPYVKVQIVLSHLWLKWQLLMKLMTWINRPFRHLPMLKMVVIWHNLKHSIKYVLSYKISESTAVSKCLWMADFMVHYYVSRAITQRFPTFSDSRTTSSTFSDSDYQPEVHGPLVGGPWARSQ